MQCRMFSFPVVINLNIFKNGRQGISMACKTLMMNQFRFYYTEKRLSDSVVPAVSLARHALSKSLIFKLLPERRTCILNPTIRVKYEPLTRMTATDRSLQSCHDHLMAQRTAQSPANHLSGEQINNHRQIQPPCFGGDVSDIRYPDPVRGIARKITLKKVFCNRIRMLRIRRRPEFSTNYRTQSCCLHSPGYSIFTDRKSFIAQFLCDLWTTAASLMFFIYRLYMCIQTFVLDRSSAFRTRPPTIVSGTRHRKYTAHLPNTPLSAVLVYEPEYLSGSSEKMATAFFKISRSRRNRSLSLLRRRNSSSGVLRCPFPGKACSPSDLSSRFHRLITPWPMPRSCSIFACVLPGSEASRTASILNSLSYLFLMWTFLLTPHTTRLFGVSTILWKGQYFVIWIAR